jgi:hypothetical protein
VPSPDVGQIERIMAVFGPQGGGPPRVSEDTLACYYRHLAKNLTFPFTAYYPQPSSLEEKAEFRSTVVELLDPTQYLGDEFDGIFCRTRKGKFEVNLPLMELHLPEGSSNFQLIEDYWYWFWNWR